MSERHCRKFNLQVCPLHMNFKSLTVVIHESLHLYPLTTVVSREAFADMKFGDIMFGPLTQHTDPGIWGPDSYTFIPERFANGIAGVCKLPQLYMSFGVGPLMCISKICYC
ncbi:unnamed protein product [Malus baccata var. baccata]